MIPSIEAVLNVCNMGCTGVDGGIDLWRASRSSSEAAFGPPENLGGEVNTDADELSPRLTADNKAFLFYRERHGTDRRRRRAGRPA